MRKRMNSQPAPKSLVRQVKGHPFRRLRAPAAHAWVRAARSRGMIPLSMSSPFHPDDAMHGIEGTKYLGEGAIIPGI